MMYTRQYVPVPLKTDLKINGSCEEILLVFRIGKHQVQQNSTEDARTYFTLGFTCHNI